MDFKKYSYCGQTVKRIGVYYLCYLKNCKSRVFQNNFQMNFLIFEKYFIGEGLFDQFQLQINQFQSNVIDISSTKNIHCMLNISS